MNTTDQPSLSFFPRALANIGLYRRGNDLKLCFEAIGLEPALTVETPLHAFDFRLALFEDNKPHDFCLLLAWVQHQLYSGFSSRECVMSEDRLVFQATVKFRSSWRSNVAIRIAELNFRSYDPALWGSDSMVLRKDVLETRFVETTASEAFALVMQRLGALVFEVNPGFAAGPLVFSLLNEK